MYRQRKRDLNLKPNRQLDKRSSRGMIYENEELRMRTIAICEDVDRGQSDIKKLRKENDHLKREIWGLRDECEKLEEMLKKVCISANLPEITLDCSSKNNDDDDDDNSQDDYDESTDDGGDDGSRSSSRRRRKRRGSGSSVRTFDSEVGSCITTMFADGQQEQEEICFADDDPGSVIVVEGNAPLAFPEPEPSPVPGPSRDLVMEQQQQQQQQAPGLPSPPPSAPVYHQHPPWSHHAAVPPDLEAVREESESTLNSPVGPSSLTESENMSKEVTVNIDDTVLPDPNLVILPPDQDNNILEGRKTPVIQITPASSPNSTNSNGNGENLTEQNIEEAPSTHGCITVVPKTYKVTSELVVGTEDESKPAPQQSTNPFVKSASTEFPLKGILTKKQDSDPSISQKPDQIVWGGTGGAYQRRSCYFPTSATLPQSQSPMSATHSQSHRNFGVLGYCCCNNDMLFGGYQSEPSLNSGGYVLTEEPNFFNAFCCRGPPPTGVTATPSVTMRSVWNTVDKNIVIGFYGYSTSGGDNTADFSGEPKVQEIIDELESQFDPTLENILGIRLIPGRIFISLKNASVVKAFLQYFKNDLILQRKSTKIRIHFIEGATAKLSTTLVLSGIPPELPDLAVISSLNQFGQVVAPLERRNYKGIDISERIAKMHLVINETSIPETVNVSGYEVRIRVEQHKSETVEVEQVKQPQSQSQIPPRKYGFIPPPSMTVATATSSPPQAQTQPQTLKAHKPVTRSSSSAPRLETPAPGQLTCPPFPQVEQKRQASVCVGNIPPDQHPSKILELGKTNVVQHQNPKVQMTLPNEQQQLQQQASSAPNLQPQPPPAKKPLARLLVSSPGSFSPTSPPGSPLGNMTPPGKGFLRRGSPFDKGHPPLTPSSSYSPRTRRKSSVQFAAGHGKGKREPLPWCGCWGLGCS